MPEAALTLFTDLYELTMAQTYWQAGMHELATFSFFFRKLPADRGYLVAAGIEQVLDYLEQFRFDAAALAALERLGRFDPAFLRFLEQVRFTGQVRAVPEGTLVFADEPLLEVVAPILEGQLVETYIVNQLHLHTLLATKAARVRWAAGSRQVIDFGARRCHGVEAATAAAYCGWLVGFDGTSNVLAGLQYNIPVYGTMAHAFISAFPREIDAFRTYARSFPDKTTLLVDTYDTLAGVRHALVVARELRQQGHELQGIRLDSGDLLELSRSARALADAAGFPGLRIFASGSLDEYVVDELVRAGAPIDAFGVGTKVGVSADAPYGDCAYKLTAYAGRPVLKLSEHKQSLPGAKQVYRGYDAAGQLAYDLISGWDEPAPPEMQPLLEVRMEQGRRTTPAPSVEARRAYFRRQFAALPDPYKSLCQPPRYEVRLSPALARLAQEVAEQARRTEMGSDP